MAVVVNRKLPKADTIAKIKEFVKTDPRYTIAALLDIQKQHGTGQVLKWTPGDAPLLGGFAQQYQRSGKLQKKQLTQAQTRLQKYAPSLLKAGGVEAVRLDQEASGLITTMNKRLLVKFDNEVLYGYLVETIKALNNYRYVRQHNHWTLPLNALNLEVLFGLGFKWKISDGLYKFYKNQTKKKNKIEVKNVSMPLRDYQQEGLEYIEAKQGNALVAFDMGLGKTPVSISYIASKGLYPAVIVCPASLKLNWHKEITRWDESLKDESEIEVLSGLKPYILNKDKKYIIVNYEIIYEWADELKKVDPQTLIVDEVQYIKTSHRRQKRPNPMPGQSKTIQVPVKRTAGVQKVGKSIPNKIGLSGTPIENKVIEFYNVLNLIRPDLFSSVWKFAYRWADLKPDKSGRGWDFSGKSNVTELNRVLSKLVMIRKKKENVLKELPDINRIMVPVEMDAKTRKEYQEAETSFVNYLMEKYPNTPTHKLMNKANVLTKMNELRQICMKGKKETCINWIKDQLEVNDKLIAFTYHREVAEQLKSNFKNHVSILGGMSSKQKDEAVTKFQRCKNCGVLHHYHPYDEKACDEYTPDDKYPLMIANLIAAAEGLTFTASSNAAMIEYQYNPAKLSQAEARLHRMGQTEKVNIWYLVAKNTLEEKIIASLDAKIKTVSEVVDGSEGDGLILGEAMDSLLKKR